MQRTQTYLILLLKTHLYQKCKYIKNDNQWVQTDHPVELYHHNVLSTTAACLIILGCVMYKANYNN